MMYKKTMKKKKSSSKKKKEFTGSHHKMPNGQIHSGKKHTKNSKRLYKTKKR